MVGNTAVGNGMKTAWDRLKSAIDRLETATGSAVLQLEQSAQQLNEITAKNVENTPAHDAQIKALQEQNDFLVKTLGDALGHIDHILEKE